MSSYLTASKSHLKEKRLIEAYNQSAITSLTSSTTTLFFANLTTVILTLG